MKTYTIQGVQYKEDAVMHYEGGEVAAYITLASLEVDDNYANVRSQLEGLLNFCKDREAMGEEIIVRPELDHRSDLCQLLVTKVIRETQDEFRARRAEEDTSLPQTEKDRRRREERYPGLSIMKIALK